VSGDLSLEAENMAALFPFWRVFFDTPPPHEVMKVSAKIGIKTGRCYSGVGMLITFK
jgi:hypothetical protein